MSRLFERCGLHDDVPFFNWFWNSLALWKFLELCWSLIKHIRVEWVS